MTREKGDKKHNELIEVARRYFEITLYGEPMTSPEHMFREVAGRLPTAHEAVKIKKRIDELASERHKNRKQE